MKKFLPIVLTMLFVTVFSMVLFADQKEGSKNEGFNGMYNPKTLLKMAADLNLTSDQFEKLKVIIKDSVKKDENKDAEKTEDGSLKAEMEKDTPDEAKVSEILTKMSEKHLAETKAKIHNALTVRAILTKDQIEILKKKEKEEKEEPAKGKDKKDKEEENE